MPQVADATLAAPPQPRLLDRVRNKIRLKHYSIRTEKAYVDWVRRYVHFHGLRHPENLGAEAVEGFLTHSEAAAARADRVLHLTADGIRA